MTISSPSSRSTVIAVTAASALLATGALAGCGNGLSRSSDDGDGTGATRVTASAGPTTDPAAPTRSAGSAPATGGAASGGSSASAGGGSSASTDPQVPPPTRATAACDAGQLSYGVETPPGGASAGSRYLLLTFKNTGGITCTMSGHPGVSFVGKGNGTQLGTPADRFGSVRTVTLEPDGTTTALLKIAEAGNYDADECAPTTSDGFRIYPPDSRAAVFVPEKVQACQGALGTGNSQLQVSAVGGGDS